MLNLLSLDSILKALYPGFDYMVLALIIAFILDFLYPEHRGLALKTHPVHTSYNMALVLAKPYSSRLRGFIVWLAVMTVHLTTALIALVVAWFISPILWVLIASLILKLSVSLRLLLEICYKAYTSLEGCRLDEGRRFVQLIVRRDVSKLDKPHVVSACLESLAESIVDGYASPLLLYAVLGPLGALAQRIANTMDGAIGFKTPEYIRVGWFSAKMDTLINFIPARLTALLIILVSPIVGGSISKTFRVWVSYRKSTESTNAGHPMSAMAGALDVRLEKVGHYTLNLDSRLPEPRDIVRGLRVALVIALLYFSLVIIMIGLASMAYNTLH